MSKRKKEAEAAAAEADAADEAPAKKKKHRVRKLAILGVLAGAVALAKKKLGGGGEPAGSTDAANDSASQPPSA
jgi:hypothetical protein